MIKFINAYIDIYGFDMKWFLELYRNKRKFMACYRLIKLYCLDDEVKREIQNGNSFFGACQEWDVLTN